MSIAITLSGAPQRRQGHNVPKGTLRVTRVENTQSDIVTLQTSSLVYLQPAIGN